MWFKKSNSKKEKNEYTEEANSNEEAVCDYEEEEEQQQQQQREANEQGVEQGVEVLNVEGATFEVLAVQKKKEKKRKGKEEGEANIDEEVTEVERSEGREEAHQNCIDSDGNSSAMYDSSLNEHEINEKIEDILNNLSSDEEEGEVVEDEIPYERVQENNDHSKEVVLLNFYAEMSNEKLDMLLNVFGKVKSINVDDNECVHVIFFSLNSAKKAKQYLDNLKIKNRRIQVTYGVYKEENDKADVQGVGEATEDVGAEHEAYHYNYSRIKSETYKNNSERSPYYYDQFRYNSSNINSNTNNVNSGSNMVNSGSNNIGYQKNHVKLFKNRKYYMNAPQFFPPPNSSSHAPLYKNHTKGNMHIGNNFFSSPPTFHANALNEYASSPEVVLKQGERRVRSVLPSNNNKEISSSCNNNSSSNNNNNSSSNSNINNNNNNINNNINNNNNNSNDSNSNSISGDGNNKGANVEKQKFSTVNYGYHPPPPPPITNPYNLLTEKTGKNKADSFTPYNNTLTTNRERFISKSSEVGVLSSKRNNNMSDNFSKNLVSNKGNTFEGINVNTNFTSYTNTKPISYDNKGQYQRSIPPPPHLRNNNTNMENSTTHNKTIRGKNRMMMMTMPPPLLSPRKRDTNLNYNNFSLYNNKYYIAHPKQTANDSHMVEDGPVKNTKEKSTKHHMMVSLYQHKESSNHINKDNRSFPSFNEENPFNILKENIMCDNPTWLSRKENSVLNWETNASVEENHLFFINTYSHYKIYNRYLIITNMPQDLNDENKIKEYVNGLFSNEKNFSFCLEVTMFTLAEVEEHKFFYGDDFQKEQQQGESLDRVNDAIMHTAVHANINEDVGDDANSGDPVGITANSNVDVITNANVANDKCKEDHKDNTVDEVKETNENVDEEKKEEIVSKEVQVAEDEKENSAKNVKKRVIRKGNQRQRKKRGKGNVEVEEAVKEEGIEEVKAAIKEEDTEEVEAAIKTEGIEEVKAAIKEEDTEEVEAAIKTEGIEEVEAAIKEEDIEEVEEAIKEEDIEEVEEAVKEEVIEKVEAEIKEEVIEEVKKEGKEKTNTVQGENPLSTHKRLCAHLTFRTIKNCVEAKKALEEKNFKVNFSAPNKPNNCLWVGNILKNYFFNTANILKSMFMHFGEIMNVKFVADKNCLFLEYKNVNDAIKARNHMYGIQLSNNTLLNIDFSTLGEWEGKRKVSFTRKKLMDSLSYDNNNKIQQILENQFNKRNTGFIDSKVMLLLKKNSRKKNYRLNNVEEYNSNKKINKHHSSSALMDKHHIRRKSTTYTNRYNSEKDKKKDRYSSSHTPYDKKDSRKSSKRKGHDTDNTNERSRKKRRSKRNTSRAGGAVYSFRKENNEEGLEKEESSNWFNGGNTNEGVNINSGSNADHNGSQNGLQKDDDAHNSDGSNIEKGKNEMTIAFYVNQKYKCNFSAKFYEGNRELKIYPKLNVETKSDIKNLKQIKSTCTDYSIWQLGPTPSQKKKFFHICDHFSKKKNIPVIIDKDYTTFIVPIKEDYLKDLEIENTDYMYAFVLETKKS
ncbi:RNA-binding protein [Plasmodium brasilianum]|uniref:RNA-binding protein n=1 Tax=Plasmodium brasilianum TaxID=5824 RepID=A0ACB9YG06_PLABR|nr:RNA-binding protein [Plasmodium brasilianum]